MRGLVFRWISSNEADDRVDGLFRERATLVSQIVQDSMDFWLPATNLGYAQLNDGVIGALG